MLKYCVYIIFVCLSSYSYVDSAAVTFFRRDYDFFDDTGSFYKVHTTPKTWNDARKQCILEGTTLAVPNTAAEAETFKKLMADKIGANAIAFLGIQAFSKGHFTTLDGIPIEDIYHGWAPGEPNDSGNIEDCVIMDRFGKLNDDNCDKKFAFICEKTQDSVTWNSACETADLEYAHIDRMDNCYKVHLTPKNWREAYATCVSEQSHLAILNSREESKALIELFNTKPHQDVQGNFLRGTILLGFYDRFKEGLFTTVQGQTLAEAGFDKWAGGQPDHPDAAPCGSMFYNSEFDGELSNNDCILKGFFICERKAGDGSSALGLRYG